MLNLVTSTIDNMNVMLHDEFADIGYAISNFNANLITFFLSLTLVPVVLIRQFNRIKVR